mgnify:CR=1 FL=1
MPDGAAAFHFAPRLMRAKAAAYYLGMSESAFRASAGAAVHQVRIGGIVGWLREDLDAWLDAQAGRKRGSAPTPDATAIVHARAQQILGRR